MTTRAMAQMYGAAQDAITNGQSYSVHNPNNAPISELPKIYAYCYRYEDTGYAYDNYYGALVAEDGTALGEHTCSSEGFCKTDLGAISGEGHFRWKDFVGHYPDGFRMDYVPLSEFETHGGLRAALSLAEQT